MSLGLVIAATSFIVLEISSLLYHIFHSFLNPKVNGQNGFVSTTILFTGYNGLFLLSHAYFETKAIHIIEIFGSLLSSFAFFHFFIFRVRNWRLGTNKKVIFAFLSTLLILVLGISAVKFFAYTHIPFFAHLPFELTMLSASFALFFVCSKKSIYLITEVLSILFVTLSLGSIILYFRESLVFNVVLTNFFFLAILVIYYVELFRKSKKNALCNSPASSIRQELQQYNLSEREIDIAVQVLNGSSLKEIANDNFIAYNSVTKHISNVYTKVGIDGDPRTKKARFIQAYKTSDKV